MVQVIYCITRCVPSLLLYARTSNFAISLCRSIYGRKEKKEKNSNELVTKENSAHTIDYRPLSSLTTLKSAMVFESNIAITLLTKSSFPTKS